MLFRSGFVFVWEVKSICRSETCIPNVTKSCSIRNIVENELIREYHKFNFSESYGAEMLKLVPR